MEANVIKMLEEKYEELKWELTLPMDDLVKKEIEKQLNDTYNTITFFRSLEGEKIEEIEWKQ